MLILCQHQYSESKVWEFCGLRPHNLLFDCNPVHSTEPTGAHCESLTILSYIELSFQAPSYDHNLLTIVYTITRPLKWCIISPHFRLLVRELSWAHNMLEQLSALMLILCQHHYSESKVWDLCGWISNNLLIECNSALSTEPTGPRCESLTMLSYIKLSFQAPSCDHNLFTRVYTLTHPLKLCIISSHFQILVRALSWVHNLLEQLFAPYVDSMSTPL